MTYQKNLLINILQYLYSTRTDSLHVRYSEMPPPAPTPYQMIPSQSNPHHSQRIDRTGMECPVKERVTVRHNK